MECPRCQGDGKCAECGGEGTIECASCSGSGQKTTSRGITYDCKGCGGTGKLDCPTECSSCEGTGVITEELQTATREKYRPKFVNLGPRRALTMPLILVNVVVFFAIMGDSPLAAYLLMYDGVFDKGHYWTLITTSFVHYWHFHLILNMLFLWYYGPIAEGILGKVKFGFVYLFCSLTAGSISYLGNVVIQKYGWAGVGASGPLFGLVGYLLAVHLRWKLPEAADGPRLANYLGAIMLIGVGTDIAGIGFLDNWGHLGGALGGLVLGYLLPKPNG